jgi:hypothetical protein
MHTINICPPLPASVAAVARDRAEYAGRGEGGAKAKYEKYMYTAYATHLILGSTMSIALSRIHNER